jgi:flavorubredoxin
MSSTCTAHLVLLDLITQQAPVSSDFLNAVDFVCNKQIFSYVVVSHADQDATVLMLHSYIEDVLGSNLCRVTRSPDMFCI